MNALNSCLLILDVNEAYYTSAAPDRFDETCHRNFWLPRQSLPPSLQA
jgi:hypothetical protein